MSAGATSENLARFHLARPTGLRRACPGHRLAYIIWLLPRRLRRLVVRLAVPSGGRVLDYGCAEQPYRHFFADRVQWVGADLPGNPAANVSIAPDGTVPVDDESFDAVLSTQVLEHVADPAVYLEECHRVLRPGGRLLLSTHGMMVYHPDPVDYWRWTGAGLRRAVEAAGFEIVHAEGIMSLAAVGLQFVQDSIYYRLPRWLQLPFAICFQMLIAVGDRLGRPVGLDENALVLAVVAEKSRQTAPAAVRT